MSQVEMLEQTVKQLSPGERAAFRSWFIEFDAAEWDRQGSPLLRPGSALRKNCHNAPIHRRSVYIFFQNYVCYNIKEASA